ncbi:MAG: PAS domain-containing sensor histidine kinase [Phycisphaerae bacterium]|nr:PAS domain-containing sensor histidine kinase [Phycisphaerae bacterium]
MITQNTEKSGQTCFAPAARASQVELDRQRAGVCDPLLQALLDSVDGYMAVLNGQRQIITCNNQLLVDLGLSRDDILGARPGEVLKCKNAETAPSGCGTANACKQCGAVNAILACQAGSQAVYECIIAVNKDGLQDTLEFRSKATKFQLDDHEFIILTMQDITSEKRRAVLERTFFHDILNTVDGISGWSSLLSEQKDIPIEEAAERVFRLSTRLIDEIRCQRDILAAERGHLQPSYATVSVIDVFENLNTLFKDSSHSAGKRFECHPVGKDAVILTDKTLLIRVLSNMVKNALEASSQGNSVTVRYSSQNRIPRFEVHNEGEIPEDVALQIFKRSFSTKAETGRGIGTYSMKLLGEEYLKGKVGFTTSTLYGTTFYIDLPVDES